jgi:Na+/proline symporter
MAGQPHKSKKEIKRQSQEFALTERRVLLFVTVMLALATLISPFLGLHGGYPTATGVGAGLSAVSGRFRR